jgi:hypothetical protein
MYNEEGMKEASSILVIRNISHGTKKHRLFCLTVFLLIFVSNKKYFDAKQSEK